MGRAPEAENASRREYLPAIRFRALTPLFDAIALTLIRENAFKPALVEQADLRPGTSVLDLGAGTGTLAIMAKRQQPQAEVTGLDADPEILAIARRKATEADVDIRLDEGYSTDLPYGDGSFDRVLSTLFFHHLTRADKEATLAEARRVLRPEGQLHIADYTRPADPIQAAISWPGRLFDGLERTRDNHAGNVPGLVAAAGFRDVSEQRRVRTVFGTVGLLSANVV